MPHALSGNLLKELRARTCRRLAERDWSQSRLGAALGVSQVMAGAYLRDSPLHYPEPTESDLAWAAEGLAQLLATDDRRDWALVLRAGDDEYALRFPADESRARVLAELAAAQRRLAAPLAALSPEVRANLALALPGAATPDEVAAFPGRLTPVSGGTLAAPPAFGASHHLAALLLRVREHAPKRSAIVNVRWDAAVAEGLTRLRIAPGELRHAGRERAPVAASARALVDAGAHGIEPALYLLDDNLEALSVLVEALARAVETIQ